MATLSAQKADGGFKLSLKIHHALYDAVSLPLILQDFESFSQRLPSAEFELSIKDFLQLSLNPKAQKDSQIFWKDYLHDLDPASLPQPQSKGAQTKVDLFQPALLTFADRLDQLARKEGVSLQALLFAAYARVYLTLVSTATSHSPQAKKRDVVLGIYLSNRAHLPDLDRLAAPTLNLLPLVVRNPARRDLLLVAKKIQADLREIGTSENSGVSLAEIDEWTGVKVDTFVNFLKLPEREEREERLLEEVDEGRRTRRSRVVDRKEGQFELPKGLEGFEAADAYQHSVDIEITVSQGVLDFGFFSPVDMAGLEMAESAVSEFKRVLEELIS